MNKIRIVKPDAVAVKKDFREIDGFVHHESFFHVSDTQEIDIDEMALFLQNHLSCVPSGSEIHYLISQYLQGALDDK